MQTNQLTNLTTDVEVVGTGRLIGYVLTVRVVDAVVTPMTISFKPGVK